MAILPRDSLLMQDPHVVAHSFIFGHAGLLHLRLQHRGPRTTVRARLRGPGCRRPFMPELRLSPVLDTGAGIF